MPRVGPEIDGRRRDLLGSIGIGGNLENVLGKIGRKVIGTKSKKE